MQIKKVLQLLKLISWHSAMDLFFAFSESNIVWLFTLMAIQEAHTGDPRSVTMVTVGQYFEKKKQPLLYVNLNITTQLLKL